MILTGCALDKTGRFIAVWRLDNGNAIHDRLPKTVTNEPAAWIYALDNRPAWEGGVV